MLQQFRGPYEILNPSAYLTKLLANAHHDYQAEHDLQDWQPESPGAQVSFCCKHTFLLRLHTHCQITDMLLHLQAKAAALVFEQSDFVPFKQSDFVPLKQSEFASNIDSVTAALADLSPSSHGHTISTSVWPAVNEASAPIKHNQSVADVECSAVESALMRCFANKFMVMNSEDLHSLQSQDLEIVL